MEAEQRCIVREHRDILGRCGSGGNARDELCPVSSMNAVSQLWDLISYQSHKQIMDACHEVSGPAS